MKRHIAYLKYIIRHKWFVFVAGLKLRVPLWQLIIHDWTKFLPSEWSEYAFTFYNKDGSGRYIETPGFIEAWNHHQKRNKHHWQYWVLTTDSGETESIPMPMKYIREMVADWCGAGRAITGKWDVISWYNKNRKNIMLHEYTREHVESILKSCNSLQ